MYVNNNDVTYFDTFGVEHISKEIKTFINRPLSSALHNKKPLKQTFSEYKDISGYFCIVFIDFMLKRKTLTEYTNLFSSNNFLKNDDIILKHFIGNS